MSKIPEQVLSGKTIPSNWEPYRMSYQMDRSSRKNWSGINDHYSTVQRVYCDMMASKIDDALVFLAPRLDSPPEALFLALFLGTLETLSKGHVEAEGQPVISSWFTSAEEFGLPAEFNSPPMELRGVKFIISYRNSRYEWFMAVQPTFRYNNMSIRPDAFFWLCKANKRTEQMATVALELNSHQYHSDHKAMVSDSDRMNFWSILGARTWTIMASTLGDAMHRLPEVHRLLFFLATFPMLQKTGSTVVVTRTE